MLAQLKLHSQAVHGAQGHQPQPVAPVAAPTTSKLEKLPHPSFSQNTITEFAKAWDGETEFDKLKFENIQLNMENLQMKNTVPKLEDSNRKLKTVITRKNIIIKTLTSGMKRLCLKLAKNLKEQENKNHSTNLNISNWEDGTF